MLLIAAAPTAAFAYGVGTHQSLTGATVQAYERLYGDVFSSTEEQKMISGSSGEDAIPRPLNHFYDPINYRGLTLGFSWQPSEEWAQDTEGQGNYCNLDAIGARNLCGARIGYNDKLFSSPTDFSWDRAIYEYVYGDKTRSLETLGHILHLLQDATVPAHARNDQHLNHNGFGDPDPYEEYASAFGPGQITVPITLDVPAYSNLGAYFDHVASFTNTHFVSKDTLFKDYSLPDINKLKLENDFGIDPLLGYKIARVVQTKNLKGEIIKRDVYLDDGSDSVMSDNWSILSKEAIQNGAGVIGLFFKKVEEEKQTGALKKKNVSAAEKSAKDLALSGFKYAKALYGSSLNQSDVEELLNEGQAGAAVLATTDMQPVQKEIASVDDTLPVVQPKLQNNQTPPTPTTSPKSPASVPSLTIPPRPAVVPQARLSPVAPGFGGGGNVASIPNTQEDGSGNGNNQSSTLSFAITSPAENSVFATTSVSFAGTTSPNALVSASFGSTATTTADGAGSWGFSLTLPESTTTVSFVASDDAGHTSATTTRTIFVDVTPPNAPSAAINECDYSLLASTCLIAATTATLSWGSISDAAYYGLTKNGAQTATTTATNATVNIADNATTTFAVVAYDAAGNAATSTSVSVEANTRPLIINEIAWAGTDADASDEWIELKNLSGYTLDLSHVAITSADGAPYTQLAGSLIATSSLVSDGYYLIERREEATSKTGNLVTPFDQLSDSGEELYLQWGTGISTTTIDRTPAVATCSGWCAGSSALEISHSEQTGATTTAKVSLERVGSGDGTLASSWASNDTYIRQTGDTSTDASGSVVNATPGSANSAHLPSAGWYCDSDAPVSSGATYHPSSGSCTYLSAFIGTQVGRYGDFYEGTVGSSTIMNGHALATTMKSTQNGDTVPQGTASGQQFFIAIYEVRNFGDDVGAFRNYFTGVNPTPPHGNYRVIPWVYGP